MGSCNVLCIVIYSTCMLSFEAVLELESILQLLRVLWYLEDSILLGHYDGYSLLTQRRTLRALRR